MSISMQQLTAVVDGQSGRLKYLDNLNEDGTILSMKVDQNFFWYNSSDGHNKNSTQASGAYIFRWAWLPHEFTKETNIIVLHMYVCI